MTEPFIRYYIYQIQPWSLAIRTRTILETLPEFNGWQWIPADKFDYPTSRGYLPGSNDAEVEYIKRKCTAIIEHNDPAKVIGNSLIWHNDKHSSAIDDFLTLCSIAQSKGIYVRGVEYKTLHGNLSIVERPIAPLPTFNEVVTTANLSTFISTALLQLRQPEWKNNTGFLPAIYWYSQAQRSFRAGMFPLEMALYWIVLEILGLAYIQKCGLQNKVGKKDERVRIFVSSIGCRNGAWGFLDDAISDWYAIRCASFHEGQLPTWTPSKFQQRWRQLGEFTSYILASLLQKQSLARSNQIGARLSGY